MPPLLALSLGSTPASATERVFEHWTEADGLPIDTVHAIGQAPDGAIWLSTLVGAVRYDGHRFEAAEPPGLPPARGIRFVDGEALVLPYGRSSPLRRVGGEVFPGPDGPLLDSRALIALDDVLWVSSDETVFRRAGETWTRIVETGGKVRGFVVDGDRLLAVSSTGAWQVHPGEPTLVLPHPELAALARFGDRWIGLDTPGRMVDVQTGEILARDLGFPGSFAERGGTLWASFDQVLVSLDAHGRLETHTLPELDGLAHPFVDREGSLWLGGSRGMVRFPEPDTVNWGAADGLPLAPIDGIEARGERLWLRTRSELTWFESGRVGGRSEVYKAIDLCADDQGIVWTGGFRTEPFRGVITRDPGPDETHFPVGTEVTAGGCAQTPLGVLINAGSDIYRTGDPPELVGRGPDLGLDDTLPELFAGPDGRLWWLEGAHVCTAPSDALPTEAAWTCEDAPGEPYEVVWSEHGAWAISTEGVLVREDGAWATLVSDVDTAHADAIAPSPRGGVWVLGIGLFARIDEGRVVERIGWKHGLVDRSPLAVHEEVDGTLWVGTRSGLSRIPAEARDRDLPVPSVVLAELTSDDQPLPDGRAFTLPWDRNRLTLRVSALSYIDPHKLRYELTTAGRTQQSTDGTFRFLDLAPGAYDVTVRSSLDGRQWSEEPVRVVFWVARPPWLQWWAILGYLATFLGIGAVIYRARVSYLLGLERQRARIALDLHDEVGSGLGSIGLIAGALPMLDDPDQAAETIASTSAELGEALTEIVWALKPDSDRVEVVLEFLEQRGRATFADPGTAFRVIRPDPMPTTRLSLPVRRTVTGIALEAMHNAAKYARASTVELTLEAAGRTWTLAIRDDGVGIDPAAEVRPGGGTGLDSMRQRAQTVGATLEIESSGEGTTIVLRFDPTAEDRRIR